MSSAPPPARRVAFLLFAGLFALYHANTTVMDEGDSVPTTLLPLSFLETGRPTFEPDRFPELFKWRSRAPLPELEDCFFLHWDTRFGPHTAREWRERGHLELNGPRYYLVESPRTHEYVSTFGPVPAALWLPFLAPFHAIDPQLAYKMSLRDTVAKLGSASLVSAVAVLLYLLARRRTTPGRALLVALLYGVGSCAFAVSSQNAWQQTATQFLLAVGMAATLGVGSAGPSPLLAGLSLGAATACRATSAATLVAVLAALALRDRRASVRLGLGALPVPLLVGAYNWHYFGSPLVFAQELVGHGVAVEKTGSPDLWQTPFFEGLVGLLASPSRGLLVFSPLLALAFPGIVVAARSRAHRDLLPFAGGALAAMAVQCKWFDWWGGWTYGYRPWLDALPALTLLTVPVIDRVTATPFRRAVVATLLAWSAFVQGLGALAYDHSWNLRVLFVVRRYDRPGPEAFLTEAEARGYADRHRGEYLGPTMCNIDLPFCRYRLWSTADNTIDYHLREFRLTRSRRLPASFAELGRPLDPRPPP